MLYHIVPLDDATRPLYVVAPDPSTAWEQARYFIPEARSITAVANNAYVGDTFPRFMAWED